MDTAEIICLKGLLKSWSIKYNNSSILQGLIMDTRTILLIISFFAAGFLGKFVYDMISHIVKGTIYSRLRERIVLGRLSYYLRKFWTTTRGAFDCFLDKTIPINCFETRKLHDESFHLKHLVSCLNVEAPDTVKREVEQFLENADKVYVKVMLRRCAGDTVDISRILSRLEADYDALMLFIKVYAQSTRRRKTDQTPAATTHTPTVPE